MADRKPFWVRIPHTDQLVRVEDDRGTNLFDDAVQKARGTKDEQYVNGVAAKAHANPSQSGVSGGEGTDGINPQGQRTAWFWNNGAKTDVIGVSKDGVEVHTGKTNLRSHMITTSADGLSTTFADAGNNARMAKDPHAHAIGSKFTKQESIRTQGDIKGKTPREVQETYEDLATQDAFNADQPIIYIDTSGGFTPDEWTSIVDYPWE